MRRPPSSPRSAWNRDPGSASNADPHQRLSGRRLRRLWRRDLGAAPSAPTSDEAARASGRSSNPTFRNTLGHLGLRGFQRLEGGAARGCTHGRHPAALNRVLPGPCRPRPARRDHRRVEDLPASQPFARSSASNRANSFSRAPARGNGSRKSRIVLASGTGSSPSPPHPRRKAPVAPPLPIPSSPAPASAIRPPKATGFFEVSICVR